MIKARRKQFPRNVTIRALAVLALAAAAGQVAGQVAAPAPPLPYVPLPEVPAVMREVAPIVSAPTPHYTRPIIPAFRTSNDGRVALSLKKVAGKMAFYLHRPEDLGQPLLLSLPGAEILASTTPFAGGLSQQLFFDLATTNIPNGQIVHSTLCDGTSQFPGRGETVNPYACGPGNADDCYDLTVLASFWDTNCAGACPLEIWGTPITVEVAQPKTASAAIVNVLPGAPVGNQLFTLKSLFEPLVTADGHLFAGRVGNSQITWHDAGGNPVTGSYDIIYSVYPDDDGAPCDVTRWTELRPISHAPYDPELQGRYGIAEYPFRDPEGFPIPDGVDIKATYPWMDRDGDNVFFTTVAATLFYWDPAAGVVRSRYGASCAPGVACTDPTQLSEIACSTTTCSENSSNTQGAAVAGLWTHGKIVLLDTTVNNTDFGLKLHDLHHRMVSLYQPNTGPQGNEPGAARVGVGRDNTGFGAPPGYTFNTTFIDSTENLLNAKGTMKPLTLRDVVWILNSGRTSDEIAFDDYVNPNGFILSSMVASLSFNGGPINNQYYHHDGFKVLNGQIIQGSGFNDEIRLQNAATALANEWKVPAYGRVHGDVRVEPVALGGIEDHGLWLDGQAGVAYDVPSGQPQSLTASPWFVGVFLDSRFADDAVRRRLLTFPDGTRVALEGRGRVLYLAADGLTVHADYLLPADLVFRYRGWAHLGLVIEDAGARVELYLNGYLFRTWDAIGSERLFTLTEGGTLHVGKAEGSDEPGVKGWIDEFKAIAEKPNPEVICNHALGTIVGIPAIVAKASSSYPASSHTLISARLAAALKPTYSTYECFHDYTRDHGAHLGNLPPGTSSVRQDLLFPEGPLKYGTARPDSTANLFCRSCHSSPNHPPSLELPALLQGVVPMEDDPRRQPLQPPRLIGGHVPADYYAPGVPASPQVAPPEGLKQDQWVFPP